MKTLRYLFMACLLAVAVCTSAQTNKQAMDVLNKTAQVIGHKGGASANFTFSNAKLGTTSGSIAIKGNKFNAHTPLATVWFNGKTQWTYMKKTQEVNVTTPTQAQQMTMNPYTFINLYKTGYNMTLTQNAQSYEVHLTAQNKKRTVQELYISINKKSYVPSRIKMRQNSTWSTITVSNFKAKNQPNSLFTFNQKDFPQAEVIDLR
ncbi:MAG: LolA-like putative outer membrane lipoprotein chaperone [Prevotella sp.]|nr:LolA-like putative outer membrane lipoprotein chaperone [Prevotella sp.]